ncbi:MAG TPA: glycosyltransferase family 2 protein [Clostridia bacterium]|nr:glycosyltransferase family 2 protein [Clostridia bacterium]
MSKILTLTIPSYNMEKYLANCLDSFIDKRILEDIEVLIVNDGSKDNTLAIAKEYEARYPDVFIAVDKQNGGHGSTINKGIELSTGKYFKVIDADDWVDAEEFVKYVQFLKTVDVDFVITNYTERYEDTGESALQKIADYFTKDKIVDVEDVFGNIGGMIPMHCTTYKTSILKDNNIRLYEKCFYVDVQYNIFPIEYLKTCICKDYNVYQYRLGRAGQSVSAEGFLKHINDHRRVVLSMLEYCRAFADKESVKYNYAVNVMRSLVFYNFNNVVKFGYNKKDIVTASAGFYKKIQKEYPEYSFNFGRIKNILWKNGLRGLKLYALANRVLRRQ